MVIRYYIMKINMNGCLITVNLKIAFIPNHPKSHKSHEESSSMNLDPKTISLNFHSFHLHKDSSSMKTTPSPWLVVEPYPSEQ